MLYAEYHTTTPDDDKLDVAEWCTQKTYVQPQFNYWHKVLWLDLLFMQFMRSQRERKFVLYAETLVKIISPKPTSHISTKDIEMYVVLL